MTDTVIPLRSKIDKLDKKVLSRIEKGEEMVKDDKTDLLLKDLMWQDNFLHIMYEATMRIPDLLENDMEALLRIMTTMVAVYPNEFCSEEVYPIALDLMNGFYLSDFTAIGERICSLSEKPSLHEAVDIMENAIVLVLALHDKATKRYFSKLKKGQAAA